MFKPKGWVVYRVVSETPPTIAQVEKAVRENPLPTMTRQDQETCGFDMIEGFVNQQLEPTAFIAIGQYAVFSLCVLKRKIDTKKKRRLLSQEMTKYEAEHQVPMPPNVKKDVLAKIEEALLEQAEIKRDDIIGIYDSVNAFIGWSKPTAAIAEKGNSRLKSTGLNLHVSPGVTDLDDEQVVKRLTEIAYTLKPDPFIYGDSCVLKGTEGETARFTKIEIETVDEIRHLIDSSYRVMQLALTAPIEANFCGFTIDKMQALRGWFYVDNDQTAILNNASESAFEEDVIMHMKQLHHCCELLRKALYPPRGANDVESHSETDDLQFSAVPAQDERPAT